MLSLRDRLLKPELFYQPGQLFRRAARLLRPLPPERNIHTPWGMSLRVNPSEVVGRAVDRLGVYDLPVSEAIFRLLRPGDHALDVGANLGYMASIMAARVGPIGAVYAFEPHPPTFARLQANLALWHAPYVHPVAAAASSVAGSSTMVIPAEFADNQGVAHLALPGQIGSVTVPTLRLDSFADRGPFALMKLDVEGHEAAALDGASDLIARRLVRHVIFEDLGGDGHAAEASLLSAGYSIFHLSMRFRGPVLLPPSASRPAFRNWLPPSLLATCYPDEAMAALAPSGWQCLRS